MYFGVLGTLDYFCIVPRWAVFSYEIVFTRCGKDWIQTFLRPLLLHVRSLFSNVNINVIIAVENLGISNFLYNSFILVWPECC